MLSYAFASKFSPYTKLNMCFLSRPTNIDTGYARSEQMNSTLSVQTQAKRLVISNTTVSQSLTVTLVQIPENSVRKVTKKCKVTFDHQFKEYKFELQGLSPSSPAYQADTLYNAHVRLKILLLLIIRDTASYYNHCLFSQVLYTRLIHCSQYIAYNKYNTAELQ